MLDRIKQTLGLGTHTKAERGGGASPFAKVDSFIDGAVRDLRIDCDHEELSVSARTHILREASRATEPKADTLAPLFLTRQRLVFAAAMPAALLALVGTFLVRAPGPGMASAPVADAAELAPVRLEVSKQDGDIVIQIANGTASHRVYRTETPGAAGNPTYANATRAFRDRLQSESNLVFYRVE